MEKNKYTKFADTLAITLVFVLFLQYVLGMYTALYIEIPEDVSGWQFMGNSTVILSHVILGILLAVISIWLLAASIKKMNGIWILFSIIGLAGIFLALMTGSAFMDGQSNDNSFLMSLGLGISLLSYAAGIYFSSVTRKISQ